MKYLAIYLFIMMVAFANAQDINKLKMDSLFAALEKNNKAMGNISIFKNGKEIYNRSIGYADYEKKQVINAETKFRIGSISKTFTATIIMQMVDEGKLKLDQTIDKYFKDFPLSDQITIEQLLRHRSGIHNFTDDKAYLDYMTKPKTSSEMVEIINKGGSDFKPGTKTKYSNSNFILLSIIAEKTDKKTYAEILKNRITTPMKLKNTSYGGKIETDKNQSQSYNYLNDWNLSTETDMSIPIGAGAIVSNPGDLNIFLGALLTGKLVKESSLEKMKTIVEGMGIGMFAIPFHEKKAFGHNGAIDEFLSSAAYFSEEKLGIAYCSNGVVMPMNDILIGVLSIYFDKPYQIPEFKILELKTEDLDCYLGVYKSKAIPIKITISKNGAKLIGQGEGQPSFPLEAFEKNKFKFDQGGILLEFAPDENKMLLKQGGGNYEFTKE